MKNYKQSLRRPNTSKTKKRLFTLASPNREINYQSNVFSTHILPLDKCSDKLDVLMMKNKNIKKDPNKIVQV